MQPKNTQKYTTLIVVWILSAVYVFGFIDRGWVPHDEGALAQSAERVLAGELPHRDFDEIYTGGLSFLYAAAFKLFGLNLVSIRIVLLIFFLAFVPAFYAIALRLGSPVVAAVVTLLTVVWSVPNYFAGVPSWYNLFFATFGTLALIRHIESDRLSWLFIAGVCGGISFLAKSVGLYYVAAGILFLAFKERIISRGDAGDREPASRAVFFLKLIGVVIFLGALVRLIGERLGAMEVFHFLLPEVAICGILLWSEWTDGHGQFAVRSKRLLGLLLPFVLGAAIPIALFVAIYLPSSSVGELYRGVFVLPQRRLDSAAMNFPPFLSVIAAVPYAVMVCFPPRRPLTTSDKVAGLVLIGLAGLALSFANISAVYQIIWNSARSLGVVAVIAGCVGLVRYFPSDLLSDEHRQRLFLLMSITALFSLVQFPFAAPIYFCYTTPFIGLTLLAVVALQSSAPKFLHMSALVFYALFAVLWTNTAFLYGLGARYSPYHPQHLLELERGRLRVPDGDIHLYTQLVDSIRKHSRSTYIYAAPDCPEIYFLSGMRNPTRKIFDFLSDTENDPTRVPALLEKRAVSVVIINRQPLFSEALGPGITEFLEARFPHSRDLGRFTMRWR